MIKSSDENVCPKCERNYKYYRLRTASYCCRGCGHQWRIKVVVKKGMR